MNRIKNWAGFPSRAVEFVLRAGRRGFGGIDVFAFSGVDMPDQMTLEQRLAFYSRDCRPAPPTGGLFRRAVRATRRSSRGGNQGGGKVFAPDRA